MEINTVVISLSRLKELELAEKKTKEPRSKTIIVHRGSRYDYSVETDDECVEKLSNELAASLNSESELRDELSKELGNHQKCIYNIRSMNIWEFLRWKKSNKK